MKRILIIGGGAAGMIAGISAARAHKDAQVSIYESNEKLGKKLFITGKGRCNVTNAAPMDQVQQQVITNPRFLYSAFDGFTNRDLMELLEEAGVPLKIERGNRVFPKSDKSSDIIGGLKRLLDREGVQVHFSSKVKKILIHSTEEEPHFQGILLEEGTRILGDALIIATGGASYATTGSTGDGYDFARSLGHTVIPPRPSLVPLVIREQEASLLQGLSLRNVKVTIWQQSSGKKPRKLYEEQGEMLFTHYGVSGPLILSGSCYVGAAMRKKPEESCYLDIDLKPALEEGQLDKRLLRDFAAQQNKNLGNSLDELLPKTMIPVMIVYAGLDPHKKVHELTKEERQRLIHSLKQFRLTIEGLRGLSEAIITQGGVSVKEVDSKTMESKLVQGVYFAGEVLDVDAMTGGYNLQIAWSTGWRAGLVGRP